MYLGKYTETFDLSAVSANRTDNSCFAWFRYTSLNKAVVLKWWIALSWNEDFTNPSLNAQDLVSVERGGGEEICVLRQENSTVQNI